MRKLIYFVLICIGFTACESNVVYNTYKSVDLAQWDKDSIIKFTFSPIDTVSRNNIYINLRNNNDYAYSNLFLIVGIEFPDHYTVVDTLEYAMADVTGKFLGSGMTDLKENKLEYKTNVIFPHTGEYTFTVQQAMRKAGEIDGIKKLKGISDVGISIEKIDENE
ncbi:gliding motility lipoprotein GldH [Flavobacteriaceae bacterium F08102]|nr:gliding motility lipoprotein GldH [Flavobacteriaceae bacterium F08102]